MAWKVSVNKVDMSAKYGAPMYDALVPVDMVSKSVISNATITADVLAAAMKAGVLPTAPITITRDDKVIVTCDVKSALDYTSAIAKVKVDFDKVIAALAKVKSTGIERAKSDNAPVDASELVKGVAALFATK